MKDQMPYVPWYHGDFLRSTAGWTLLERATYWMLLCAEWESGPLPNGRFHSDLPEKDWYIHLEPVAGQSKELRGEHEYTRGIETYQEAVERYRRIE